MTLHDELLMPEEPENSGDSAVHAAVASVGDSTGDSVGDPTGDASGNSTSDAAGNSTGEAAGNSTGDAAGNSVGNQSVARAVQVLDALADARGDMELGVTELSEATGLAKSVVSRILAPLVAGGYVERNDRTRRYRIGVRLFELGLRFLRRSGAREAALGLLQELSRETGATSYLGVLDGAHCIVLAAIEGSDRLRVVVTAGERTPVQATAMGKAILAALGEEAFEALLARGLPEPAAHWHTLDSDALRADIRASRRRGYAVTQRDGYPGVWSVGAALPLQGETLMSISVDLPAYSATEEQLHDVGRLLAARTSRFAETALTGMLL